MKRAVFWFFLILFALLFSIDLWLVATARIQPFDESTIQTVVAFRNDRLTTVFRAVSHCGDVWSILGLCVLLIALPGRTKIGLPVSLMVTVGALAQTLFKELVARPRPDAVNWLAVESTYSFPSGHSCTSMIFWVAMAVLLGRFLIIKNKKIASVFLRIGFVAFAGLIGVSRVYIGVHFPSDVVGGWLLAGTILIVCFALYDKYWPVKWRMANDACALGKPIEF